MGHVNIHEKLLTRYLKCVACSVIREFGFPFAGITWLVSFSVPDIKLKISGFIVQS